MCKYLYGLFQIQLALLSTQANSISAAIFPSIASAYFISLKKLNHDQPVFLINLSSSNTNKTLRWEVWSRFGLYLRQLVNSGNTETWSKRPKSSLASVSKTSPNYSAYVKINCLPSGVQKYLCVILRSRLIGICELKSKKSYEILKFSIAGPMCLISHSVSKLGTMCCNLFL